MKKVILWGNTIEYDYYQKYIELEEFKGNIYVQAIIFNEGKFIDGMDEIPIIGIEEVMFLEYDYLIDMNEYGHDERLRIIDLLQIPREKIVPVELFEQPFFDFGRWHEVKESKVSIVSNHGWGDLVCETLKLPNLSLFKNIIIENDTFYSLCSDVKGYISKPLVYEKDGYSEIFKKSYPIMKLDDVILHFVQSESKDDAEHAWENVKKNLIFSNYYIEAIADTKEELKCFLELSYKYKICFTRIPCSEKNVIYVHDNMLQQMNTTCLSEYVNKIARNKIGGCKECDLLKLLNREPDFWRVVY